MPALSTSSSPSFGQATAGFLAARLGGREIGLASYGCAVICVVAQALTVWMTWPLWQARTAPPNLPLWDRLPQIPFGGLVIASLLATLVMPRLGSVLHAGLLAIACAFDQLRTQPQFICLAVLLVTAVHRDTRWFARWFLASLWLWAGLHKLLSPDWHGEQSWLLAAQMRLEPARYHQTLALLVATYEIALGILAIAVPRWAIALSVPLHVGISVALSPILANWNATVIPWNLAMASVGSWLLWQVRDRWPASGREAAVALGLLAMPAGFYVGWVDHYCAFVLYSDNVPRGLITTRDGCHEIETWSELNAAFPYERRLLRQYFQRTAQPGWKLHVADPRRWLGDEYWLKQSGGLIERISIDEFFDSREGTVAGVAYDDRRSVFRLSIAGARLLKRQPQAMIYAVEIKPPNYRPELLEWLGGLPNLEQLQLRDCSLDDGALKKLPRLRKLVGIGLEGTNIDDAALETLQLQPRLRIVEADRTRVTAGALERAGLAGGTSPTTTD